MERFQKFVDEWVVACFSREIASDKQERNHRFLEESLELAQACGATKSEAMQLVDYVYGRPIGEPAQEVGGVMLTVAALCNAHGIDIDDAAHTELNRVWGKIEIIRAKQAAKPKMSALPEAPPKRDDVVPGKMRCAKCTFVLMRRTMDASTGQIGISVADNSPESCPNGCGPLWPVTWEQEARECWDRLEFMAAEVGELNHAHHCMDNYRIHRIVEGQRLSLWERICRYAEAWKPLPEFVLDVKALFKVGDRVQKLGGSYSADGTIKAVFLADDGSTRYVFRFDQPAGLLHIFTEAQLFWPKDGVIKPANVVAFPISPTAQVSASPLVDLTDDEIDNVAADGMFNAAGGIYATRVYDFARAIIRAAEQKGGGAS